MRTLFVLAVIYLILCRATLCCAQAVDWIQQFGTKYLDASGGISLDNFGNVFVSGVTEGVLTGPSSAVSNSAFLRKYDAAGSVMWTRQFGPTESSDRAGIAADGLGNAYVFGNTIGNLHNVNAGFNDFYVRKYDSAGNLLWGRQGGTSGYEYTRNGAVDNLGNLYITGFTSGNLAGTALGSYDAFVIKYDPLGNQVWSRQFGSPSDEDCEGVAVDGLGNVYVAGHTSGNVGGPFAGGNYDMFLAKYDASGNSLWKRQVGTSSWDSAYTVGADPLGNVYLVGYTEGVMDSGAVGGGDIVLIKFDAAGNVIWNRQFGTPYQDISGGTVSFDAQGNLYLSGLTGGALGGPNLGPHDAFALKFLASGTLDWVFQIGSTQTDFGQGVAHDGKGNLYFVGMTEGTVAGTSAGGADAFVVKLKDLSFVPEPNTLVLMGSSFFLWAWRSRRHGGRPVQKTNGELQRIA